MDGTSDITEALLVWLVLYASLFAICGFTLVVLRGFAGRAWSNRAILRACSGVAFVGSVAIWLLGILLARGSLS